MPCSFWVGCVFNRRAGRENLKIDLPPILGMNRLSIGIGSVVQTVVQNPVKALYFARTKLIKPKLIENSSFFYAREDEEMSTVLYVYNYWSENYKIERPELTYTLLDAAGRDLGSMSLTLEPNSVNAVPVSKIMDACHVSKPFEGSVLGTIASEKLFDKRPFQMNVDYFYDNGKKMTSVHSQGGFAPYPDEELQTSYHISGEENQETFLVIRNTLTGKRFNGKKFAPVISLLNHRGERIEKKGPVIPPKGMARVKITELFPEARAFLDGKAGNAEVKLGAEVLRSLFYIYDSKKKTYSFNHGTEHKTVNPKSFFTYSEMKQMGVGPVNDNWLIENVDLHTRSIPCVNICEGESSYHLDLTIFDEAGKKIGMKEKVCTVSRGTVPTLDFSEILSTMSVQTPFQGTFQLSLHAEEGTQKYPRTFSLITEFYNDAQHGGVQFDSGLLNMPTHNLSNEFQTTKIFGRVIANEKFKTKIGLINGSGEAGCTRASNSQIMLIGGDGKIIDEKTILLPPNGAQMISLEESFPEIQKQLASWNGVGLIKVRDRTCRVIGYHFVENRHNELMAVDHLVGG